MEFKTPPREMEIPPYAGSHHIFLASETFKTEEKDANH